MDSETGFGLPEILLNFSCYHKGTRMEDIYSIQFGIKRLLKKDLCARPSKKIFGDFLIRIIGLNIETRLCFCLQKKNKDSCMKEITVNIIQIICKLPMMILMVFLFIFHIFMLAPSCHYDKVSFCILLAKHCNNFNLQSNDSKSNVVSHVAFTIQLQSL